MPILQQQTKSSSSLFTYISHLPTNTVLRLYKDPKHGPYICKAIFQHLPAVAQQYCLRLSCSVDSYPLDMIRLWTKDEEAHDEALRKMQELYVIEPLPPNHHLDEDQDEETADDDGAGYDSVSATSSKLLKSTTAGAPSTSVRQIIVKLIPEFQQGLQKCFMSTSSAPWVPAEDLNYNSLSTEAGGYESEISSLQSSTSVKTKLKLKVTSHKQNHPPTLNELELYTQTRWDSVLHFLVGSVDYEHGPPPAAVVNFLETTGLMQEDLSSNSNMKTTTSDLPLVITSKGYEFMLLDVHVQVWHFVLQYLNAMESNKRCEDIRHEALIFLICLSYCRVGQAYSAAHLSKYAFQHMKNFSTFGLLKIYNTSNDETNRNTIYFYPTRVAVNLVMGSSNSSSSTSQTKEQSTIVSKAALEEALASPIPSTSHLAIIVQTNFQLAAYTTSDLHVSMLDFFCEMSTFRRLPNVVFYKITRDSVKNALRLGIKAEQVLQFLKMNAHPKLRDGDQPLVPPNVEDQIILWDRERHRVKTEKVWVYRCQNEPEFNALQYYASDLGALCWSSESTYTIMVNYKQVENVMEYIKKYKVRSAAAAVKRKRADRQGSF